MNKIVKISLFVFALFFVSANAFGLMIANESCAAYDGCLPPPGSKTIISGSSIGQLIVTGAGHFLQSYSDMMLFCQQIETAETSGADYTSWRAVIDRAIENLAGADDTYKILAETAGATPYNPDVIAKLAAFDYAGFMAAKGLNPAVFVRVVKLLRRGDVTGVYVQLQADCAAILERLTGVRTLVDQGIFPDIESVWRINQEFAQTMLFGQYVAEVFYALK